MTTETVKKLKDLVGKPVTVFTENIGRGFTENQYNDYFTGICTFVGIDIIETLHPITKCKNLFFIKNIIAICEEQQLDPNDPEHKKIINEISSSKNQQDLPLTNSENIDIGFLSQLSKK